MDQRKIRALQNVRRFNFERCNRYQSVAEHSFHAGLLAMDAVSILGLGKEEGWAAVRATFMHDAAEAVTGDLPLLVRNSLMERELAKLEGAANRELILGEEDICIHTSSKHVVEFCDALELLMYLKEEDESGNWTLDPIFNETASRLAKSSLWSSLRGWACQLMDWPTGYEPTMAKPPKGLKH